MWHVLDGQLPFRTLVETANGKAPTSANAPVGAFVVGVWVRLGRWLGQEVVSAKRTASAACDASDLDVVVLGCEGLDVAEVTPAAGRPVAGGPASALGTGSARSSGAVCHAHRR